MARDDKVCILCNKAYKYCEACPSKYNITETWRNIFCCENCREVYHIYDLMKGGKITDKNAGKSLVKLDMSYKEKFNEPMRSTLALAINAAQSPKKEKEIEEVKPVDKETPKKRGRKKNSEESLKG